MFDALLKIDKREVILLKGHNVDFGAPIAEMVQLGGGKIVEAGYANGSKLTDISDAVNENTFGDSFCKISSLCAKRYGGCKRRN